MIMIILGMSTLGLIIIGVCVEANMANKLGRPAKYKNYAEMEAFDEGRRKGWEE